MTGVQTCALPILAILESPARKGNSAAVRILEQAYAEDTILQKEKSKLADILTEAANAGSLDAMSRLGLFYAKTNPKLAEEWLQKAYEAGDDSGMAVYASLLLQSRKWNSLFSLLKDKGEEHDSLSCYWLATCYYKGYGTQKNISLARRLAIKAAKDLPLAQYAVAHDSMAGTGLFDGPNYERARIYFRKYLSPLTDNYSKPFRHEAEKYLAYLYYQGKGGEKQLDEFRHYAKKACDGGQEIACGWIEQVRSKEISKEGNSLSPGEEVNQVVTQVVDEVHTPIEETSSKPPVQKVIPLDLSTDIGSMISETPSPNSEEQKASKIRNFIIDFLR